MRKIHLKIVLGKSVGLQEIQQKLAQLKKERKHTDSCNCKVQAELETGTKTILHGFFYGLKSQAAFSVYTERDAGSHHLVLLYLTTQKELRFSLVVSRKTLITSAWVTCLCIYSSLYSAEQGTAGEGRS